MLIAMISLAGVPFTAGFLGKFLIFDAAIQHHQFVLAAVGVITVGLRLLLLFQSRARDVLAGAEKRGTDFNQWAFTRCHVAADDRKHLARGLSAADSERAKSLNL